MEELIIKEREFREKLVELINSSNLPAFIIKPTLKDLYEQVNILEEQQYNKAVQEKAEKDENRTDEKLEEEVK